MRAILAAFCMHQMLEADRAKQGEYARKMRVCGYRKRRVHVVAVRPEVECVLAGSCVDASLDLGMQCWSGSLDLGMQRT